MRIHKQGLLALGTLILALTCVGAGEAQAPAGPRFGENYRLASDTPGRSRDVPGLTVDPANANHIVEADIDPINLQCDFHTSFDGGRTWNGGHLTIRQGNENPPWPTPACSPNFDAGGYAHFNTGIVFGSGQNVYIAFSSQRGAFTRLDTSPLTLGGAGDDVVVARSTDGGRSFEPAVLALPGGGPNPQPVSTRPQLAVAPAAGAGGQDRLYVNAWQLHIMPNGGGPRRMLVARSDNGGASWTAPVVASAVNVRSGADAATAETTDEVVRELAQPVVGPDGAVYAAYRNRDPAVGGTTCPPNPTSSNQRRSCIVVARSTDLGQTWQQFGTGVPLPVASGGQPKLAIDPTTPAGIGTLYVAFHGQLTGGDTADIMLQKSVDRGQTWTPNPPVRVNDDALGAVQAFPWVAVPSAGRVDVTWFDRRHPYPGTTRLGDIYTARSSNAGISFGANRRVTDRTFNRDVGLDSQLGGYGFYGPVLLPLPDGRGLAAWTDSREGSFETGFQDIYLSRFDPAAPIERSSIATATPAGLSVRLSRLAYPGGSEALSGDPVTRVVVVNQDDVAGALAGAVLARASWGPLLLSPADSLPAVVRSESARMRPEGAYVIGDRSALSNSVSGALTETTRDREGVVRVASPESVAVANRPAEVARRVAELLRPLPGGSSPEAVIVNPKTPEAAAGAALAAALKLPILFVDERTTIPPPTSAAISSLGIKKLLIVGGTGSVNAAVASALGTAIGDATMVKRLSGTNPLDTSEAVAAEARTRGLPSNVVYAADGARPVEGAALGAAVGRLNGLMLLPPGASGATAEARVTALGFDAAVDRVVSAIGTGGSDPEVAGPPTTPTPTAYPLPPANLQIPGCRESITRNLIVMTNGNDTRNGTAAADKIFAGDGVDVVDALGGDDCVDLGPGNDRGNGSSGDDFVQGGLGDDTVAGGTGNDNLRGFLGNDRLDGESGDDLIVGGIGRDRITGGTGKDNLQGESGADRIAGGSGNDRISGGSGNDSLTGNSGADRITGGSGRDRMSAGSGADRISAFDGSRDRINCGSGRDRVSADRIDRVSRNCERVRRR